MRDKVKVLLSQFTGHENIIAVPRVLIDVTDDWTLAAMLNQLLYWSSQKEWIYKSLDDWNNEVGGVSRYKMNQLKELPYIETKLKKANGSPTTHYKVHWDVLERELLANINDKLELPKSAGEPDQLTNLADHLPKTANPTDEKGNSLTKTTTETTKDLKGLTALAVAPDIQDPEYIPAGHEFDEPEPPPKKTKGEKHKEMVQALMDATELDMKIKLNAGRIYKASKELRDAGYTPDDVKAFMRTWPRDWRYQKDLKPPAISVIQAEIKKGRTDDDVLERKLAAERQIRMAQSG